MSTNFSVGSLAYCLDRSHLHHTYGGPYFVYARITVDVVIITAMITVNVLLIIAIVSYRRFYRGSPRVLNSNSGTKFVLMLAISDVIVGLATPMYLIPHYFCNVDDLVRFNKYLCMMKFVATVFAAVMSNISMLFIAIDRYVAIEYTLRVCNWMIAGQISFSIITSCVLFFWNNWEGTFCDLDDVLPYGYVMLLGTVLHSLILITVAGVHIQLHRKASSRRSSTEFRMTRETSNNLKSAKVVILVAGMYFLCWTPYTICLMVRASYRTTTPLLDFVFQICVPFSYANSLINPFIYAWKNKEIQMALMWFIKKVMPNSKNTHGFSPRNGY